MQEVEIFFLNYWLIPPQNQYVFSKLQKFQLKIYFLQIYVYFPPKIVLKTCLNYKRHFLKKKTFVF